MSKNIDFPADLPIVGQQDLILQTLAEHQVVIIAGDTGSGKTTQLPKMCLLAGRGQERLIGCTQPRRLAATSVAARVAEELGDARSLVGYKIRFQDRTSRSTRIKFMTDGILLAEAQRDPLLRAYDTIIVDEAHERTLNIDFLLGILKRILGRRQDLQVIITSATIDTEKFSRHFNQAPVIEVSGRTYPVEVRYLPAATGREKEEISPVEQAVEAVRHLRREERPGDILIFMPTERDIRETAELLEDKLKAGKEPGGRWAPSPVILPLFGRLSGADQNRVFAPHRGQKIVIATNVAETSITVPGIRYVVDTGLARMAFYNVRARTTKMPVVSVSRASADQRQGRCGRIGPGLCLRLYSEEEYEQRPAYTPPEILRSNLAEVILRMLSLRLGDPEDFPFVDPPSSRAIRDGYTLLQELGALDDQRRLTRRGRFMARLPLDPRISRMLLEARDRNCLQEISIIGAALSIQDPRLRPADQEQDADRQQAEFVVPGSDFLSYLKIWERIGQVLEQTGSRSRLRKFCRSSFLSYQRLREWQDIYEQIRQLLEEENRGAGRDRFLFNTSPAKSEAVHCALLSGNLRNIGLKKEKNVYQGAGGKELVIFPGSGQYNRAGQWVMAAELVETSRLYARTVATINPAWLEPLAGSLCRSTFSSPHWEKKRGQVVALEKVTLFGLPIVAGRRVDFGRRHPEEARQIFIQAGLLEGELKGAYGFLLHNQQLLAELEGMEDRLRMRDIRVDEQTLHDFYDQRLAPEVRDQASLNRFLKQQRSDDCLRMRREDILRSAPDQGQLEQFPATLTSGDVPLQLTYRFEPGTETDGVTVRIPAHLCPQLDGEPFEWLVPGLLTEKITFLLRGLPKSLRKQLIPLPQTVEELRRNLTPYQGSLLAALERTIADRYHLRIERRQWPIDTLPPHLRMRFSLVDAEARELQAGRSWSELGQVDRSPSADGFLAEARAKWEQDGITGWDFEDLPDRITLTDPQGTLRGFAYPALTPDAGSAVAVRLTVDPEEARRLSRQGLLTLYRLQFPKQCKAALHDFGLPRTDWPLYEGLGSHEQFNAQLVTFILEEVFETREGRLPDRKVFENKVREIKKKGIYPHGCQLAAEVREVLQERRLAIEQLVRYEGIKHGPADTARFAVYWKQLETILPPDFLTVFNRSQLADSGRYLKGLRIRVERAHAAPAKDAAKAALVAPHEQQLERCATSGVPPGCHNLVEEYRQMIEEYKISLFAQEIKTAFPISEKRLQKKWDEIGKVLLK